MRCSRCTWEVINAESILSRRDYTQILDGMVRDRS
jgi:hypothetical protein